MLKNTYREQYETIIKSLMDNDRNATWDEIFEDSAEQVLEAAVDQLILSLESLLDPSEGVEGDELEWYKSHLIKAKELRVGMDKRRVVLSLPQTDIVKLYEILEHSYLTNHEYYKDLEPGSALRYAGAFAGILETVYHEQTGEYVKEMYTEWEEINTGGNCMVWYRDFRCTDGKVRMVGVAEDVFLYKYSYNEYWVDDSEKDDVPELVDGEFEELLSPEQQRDVYRKYYKEMHR